MPRICRRTALGAFAFSVLLQAQSAEPTYGHGWNGEFEHAAKQILALANATPSDKFAWRPASGVRSTSELYMHIAITNYYLLARAGAKTGGPHWPDKITAGTEKSVTRKADVIRWLTDSFAAVRAALPAVDGNRDVKFVDDKPAKASDILLRLLVHNHEHMGQAIAYARMSGVTPPWSKSKPE